MQHHNHFDRNRVCNDLKTCANNTLKYIHTKPRMLSKAEALMSVCPPTEVTQ